MSRDFSSRTHCRLFPGLGCVASPFPPLSRAYDNYYTSCRWRFAAIVIITCEEPATWLPPPALSSRSNLMSWHSWTLDGPGHPLHTKSGPVLAKKNSINQAHTHIMPRYARVWLSDCRLSRAMDLELWNWTQTDLGISQSFVCLSSLA